MANSTRATGRPAGWPRSLPPASTAEFEQRVGPWLLDRCPPETRASDVLKAHNTVLAGIALAHTHAALEALREVYRNARVTVLADLEPKAAADVLTELEALGARLAVEYREVGLVATALGLETGH
jgi:hypothetical protein